MQHNKKHGRTNERTAQTLTSPTTCYIFFWNLNQTRLGFGMNVFSTYSNVMFLVFSPVLESKTIVSFLKDKRPKKYYKLKENCLINTTLESWFRESFLNDLNLSLAFCPRRFSLFKDGVWGGGGVALTILFEFVRLDKMWGSICSLFSLAQAAVNLVRASRVWSRTSRANREQSGDERVFPLASLVESR